MVTLRLLSFKNNRSLGVRVQGCNVARAGTYSAVQHTTCSDCGRTNRPGCVKMLLPCVFVADGEISSPSLKTSGKQLTDVS